MEVLKMDLVELTKDKLTLQEVMENAKQNNINLTLYETAGGVDLEILSVGKDYALVQERVMMGSENVFIHPYGGNLGYIL